MASSVAKWNYAQIPYPCRRSRAAPDKLPGSLCAAAKRRTKAIQAGGRGQWRVEEKMLEQYIEERYAEASRMIQEAKSEPLSLASRRSRPVGAPGTA